MQGLQLSTVIMFYFCFSFSRRDGKELCVISIAEYKCFHILLFMRAIIALKIYLRIYFYGYYVSLL